MKVTGNTILITGGSSGIGLELAKELVLKNNKVLICGRSVSKLQQAKLLIPGVEIFECDISQEEECFLLYEWVRKNHPSCNILINNAAITNLTEFIHDKDILKKASDEFQTNTLAPIRLSKLFLAHLLKNKNASIINITTGLVYAPRAVYPFYNATKAALHSFTQVLRMQLANTPVSVIEVLMPAVDTPWHKGKPPKIAIPVEKAVSEMLEKLERTNKTEIKIGGVKILYWLARIAPGFAIKKINAF